MSNIGLLRCRVDIQSYAQIMDSTFQAVDTWTTIMTVWAKIDPTKGNVYFNGQQVAENVTHKVTIRYQPHITSELWLMMENRRFRIRRVKDVLERHRFLEMLVEEVFLGKVPFEVGINAVSQPLLTQLPAVD